MKMQNNLRNRRYAQKSFILALVIAVFGALLLSLSSPVYVQADHGRTAAECDRISDPGDRELCREHALQNPGGAQETSSGLRPDIKADCETDDINPETCGIIAYLKIFTDALAVIFGIVVVMMIVIGGIQYSSAGSNPQAVAAAKKRITQAISALVIYIFLFAFLQWLVPGGVL